MTRNTVSNGKGGPCTGARPGRRSMISGVAGGLAAGLALTGAAPVGAWAQVSIPGETGRPVRRAPAPLLTVAGKIRVKNRGDETVFDRAMLESLGSATITTTTPWYEGPVRFEGVPMAKLLEAVGAEGETLTAIALNDYSTDIPVEDVSRFGVLLATRRDGAVMPVSDRGPLFIIYPYDSNPTLRSRLYYSRSAWSVARLVVR